MSELPPEISSPPPSPARYGTVLAWSAIVLVIGLLLVGRWSSGQRRDADDDAARNPAADVAMTINARYALGLKLLFDSIPGGDEQQRRQVEQLLRQVERAAQSPVQRVRAATVIAESRGAGEAIEWLETIDVPEDEPELRQDVTHLRTLYARELDALDDDARARLVQRHRWFGELAAGWGQGESDPQREQALDAALRTAITGIAATIGGVVVAAAALALCIVAIVLLVTGRIRAAYRPHVMETRGTGGVFVEAFALYLAWFVVIGLLARRLGADGGMQLFWSILSGAAPLACLWPLLRGVRFGELRRALGWQRGRGWLREAGAGAVGYLAGIPIIVIGIVITLLITRATDAQPSHPIIEEISARLPDVLALLALASIYAPLAEETMFRGALYHGLRTRWPFFLSAAIVAFIFAIIHPQGLAAVPALGSIALVLAALREWRGSIVAPVVAHAINNGVLMVLLVLMAG